MKNGNLDLIKYARKLNKHVPNFIAHAVLYDLVFLINHARKKGQFGFDFLSRSLKIESIDYLKEVLSAIAPSQIRSFNLLHLSNIHRDTLLKIGGHQRDRIGVFGAFTWVRWQLNLITIKIYSSQTKALKFVINGHSVTPIATKRTDSHFLDLPLESYQYVTLKIPSENFKLSIINKTTGLNIPLYNKGVKKDHICSEDLRRQITTSQPIKSNGIWIIMDKDNKADDNGEHLYRYIMKNKAGVKAYFALRKSSRDWARLEKEGFNLIEFGSNTFKSRLMECENFISSHLDSYITDYLGKYTLSFLNFTFLQHGITKDDISAWFNGKNISLLCCGAIQEHEALSKDGSTFAHNKNILKFTGFTRFDSLLRKAHLAKTRASKKILIIPTWRKNLAGIPIPGSADRLENPFFRQSQFFKEWYAFLNSIQISDLISKGFEISFLPHPNLKRYLKYFETKNKIKILDFVKNFAKNVVS